MKHTFVDNYCAFEAEVTDKRGRKKTLKAITFTDKMVTEFPALCKQFDDTDNLREKLKITKLLMVSIFGGKPRDYKKYSLRLCWDIIKSFTDDMTKNAKAVIANPPGNSVTKSGG